LRPGPADCGLAIITDLPDAALPDTPAWRERRGLAARWARLLAGERGRHRLDADLFVYRNVRTNNADLPATAWRHGGGPLPSSSADDLDPGLGVPFTEIFATRQILIAPTELSATAPLKLNAPRFGFRAATLPGFSRAMIPALRLDYGEVNRRVMILKALLDRAQSALLSFRVEGGSRRSLTLDLRHRTAHASGGLLTQPGTAGNLPSGEAYIVPYEGELDGDPSRSAGTLPVELDGEVVVYRIEGNRAVEVLGGGEVAGREAARIAAEPAYGNIAELGLGVLAGFGIEPVGEVLLDEKLGLHVAFGRSDHFGGAVGAADFSTPEAVVHQDRVYVPAIQPRVRVEAVELEETGGARPALMRDGRYVVDFDGGGAGANGAP